MMWSKTETAATDLAEKVAEFQRATFPGATIHGAVTHLLSEAMESFEELNKVSGWDADGNPNIVHRADIEDDGVRERLGEELADVFHMIVQVANLGGINLPLEIEAKLAKNKLRKWKPPSDNGVIEHAEEGER